MQTNTNPQVKDISSEAFEACASFGPSYGLAETNQANLHQGAVKQLWAMETAPLLSPADSTGRFSGAKQTCPDRSCAAYAVMAPGAASMTYRNPDAFENIFCAEGEIQIAFEPNHIVTLGRYDFLSVPVNVKHRILNTGDTPARFVIILSAGPSSGYPAVFDASLESHISPAAAAALGVSFDSENGSAADATEIDARVSRFSKLVAYKNDLHRTAGIPPEATEMLSAGSVFPLIVPVGHIGRSRTAPMYGNAGLYISIAECMPGTDDAPPPHAHSDTQENFFVLDGTWDILGGRNRELVIPARAHDIVAAPPGIMRTFLNKTAEKARLLVIIQGPEKMNDTVTFSAEVGAEIARRFGQETIEAYGKIRMAFEAAA
ncbi:cupin domain-containing protein [Paraburkholderia bannensis]|uniref:cupin domain-containing protein n=1 Tax=Paraburkholderia bannensis TaxID=765414 RepID=UPI002AAF4F24|nr:cupin domain-containing protein [Paraburkholderia bannensis]